MVLLYQQTASSQLHINIEKHTSALIPDNLIMMWFMIVLIKSTIEKIISHLIYSWDQTLRAHEIHRQKMCNKTLSGCSKGIRILWETVCSIFSMSHNVVNNNLSSRYIHKSCNIKTSKIYSQSIKSLRVQATLYLRNAQRQKKLEIHQPKYGKGKLIKQQYIH